MGAERRGAERRGAERNVRGKGVILPDEWSPQVIVSVSLADCRLSVGHCVSRWQVWRGGRESWRWRLGD